MNCNYCGKTIRTTRYHHYHRYYCQECFKASFFTCSGCGYVGYKSDMNRFGNRRLCYNCYVDCQDEWLWDTSTPDVRENTFDETRSQRKFGVELETSNCPGHTSLRNHTTFGVHEHGSINGLEFVSPILQGDKGLEEIRKFCRLAHKRKFQVDRQCGLHIHLDMRGKSVEQCRNTAYAYHLTYPYWQQLVHPSRDNNSYSRGMRYDRSEILRFADFSEFSTYQDRYQFINWSAYNDHGTVEVRGHEGSLHAPEICNWIKTHARFVDGVESTGFNTLESWFGENKEHNIRRIVGPELFQYFAKKSKIKRAVALTV
jgi:hypothetical protein